MNHSAIVKDEECWTRVAWSPYAGKELVGWPVLTVVNGTPVFERNQITGHKGKILVEPGSVGEPILMSPWK